MTTWNDIPGWFDFDDIYDQMIAEAPQEGARFVELGMFFGRSTLYMADAIRRSGKSIEFISIDLIAYNPPKKRRPEQSDEIWDLISKHGGPRKVFDYFLRETGLAGYVKPMIGDSAESAWWFPDESLDFVFNDAGHDYASLKKSLASYMPKVKKGGVFGGHDYRNHTFPDVSRVVDEVLPDREIKRTSFFYRKTK